MNAHRPLGFVATTMESSRQALLRLRHLRLWWFVAGGGAVLFGAAWLLASRVHERIDGHALFCILAWWLHGTVLMPWLSLWLGISVVHGILEDRSFQYLFLRPVGRVPLLLGRFLAVVVASSTIAVLGTVVLMLGLAQRRECWPDGVDWRACWVFATTLAAGSVAYSAAAMLFATWFRRPLLWAAFFVVGLQQLAANLDVSAGLRQLTITDPMRRLLFDGLEPNRRLAEMLWPAEPEFTPDQIGQPLINLAWFTGITLLLAAVAWRTIEYDARTRD